MKQIVAAICLFVFAGCRDAPRLAIYLVEKPSPNLAQIEIAETPLLTDADIVSYNWQTHSLVLTDEGFEKLPTSVGTEGKPFIVVADGQRCYLAAFWTYFSSLSHPNPVINVLSLKPPFRSPDKMITIERAYPGPIAGEGKDPRSDKRILKVLTELNKLKDTPNKEMNSNKK
jgi:hypothetical protein